MRNPNCPKCEEILDTFADGYWCPRCRVRFTKNLAPLDSAMPDKGKHVGVARENNNPVIENELTNKNTNRNIGYMLFALGALVLIIGIYLSTYTTATMVNESMSLPYLGNINVPHPEQIQPYLPIGIILIISAIILIAVALYEVTRK
jgi:hypothetical protein